MMISISQSIFSQDNIYFLYNQMPLTVNPSLAGSDCGPRASVYYQQLRNDFFDFNNYYSKGLNFDIPIVLKNNDKIGLGYKLMHDVAGDSKFSNLGNYLSVAYHKSINKNAERPQYLSVGVEAGIANSSLAGRNLRWPSQIGPGGYNPTLPSNENIDLSVRYFDINLGISWTGHIGEKIKSTAGVAINHVNTPNRSLLGSSDDLGQRFVSHIALDIAVNDKWSILPSAFYTHHYQFGYYIFSANIGHQFTNTTRIQLGGGYAKNDQPFINATFNYKMMNLGVAYGFINNSALDRLEIVFGYTFGDYSCGK